MLNRLVCGEDLQQFRILRGSYANSWTRFFCIAITAPVLDIQEIEERVRRMRIVPAEGLQTELTVHKNHRIVRLEEVFSGGSTSCAWRKFEPMPMSEKTKRQVQRPRTSAEIVQESNPGQPQGKRNRMRRMYAGLLVDWGSHTFSSRGTVVPPL